MDKDQILEQIERLPTLVEKLRFIDESFPTKGDILKTVFQEALTLPLKRQLPLFAEQIKPDEPEETLDGGEAYIAVAYQTLHINKYYDIIIEQYAQNPLIVGTQEGYSLSNRFNSDRKNWEHNKADYTGLIGDKKLKRTPILRRTLNHPIVYLEERLSDYHQRQKNRPGRSKIPA